jgi:hypothetical protein
MENKLKKKRREIIKAINIGERKGIGREMRKIEKEHK